MKTIEYLVNNAEEQKLFKKKSFSQPIVKIAYFLLRGF